MAKEGTDPNVVSYSSVLHACAKVLSIHLWASIETLVEIRVTTCHEAKARMSCNVINPSRRLDQWVYPNLSDLHFACQLKACEPARAEAWLQHMVSQGVEANHICYNAVIHACSKTGVLTQA
eukprot:6487471-Amphidinium_carterae.1